jgi:heme/copper-type cytochrome/quinol oxidase subunit 1
LERFIFGCRGLRISCCIVGIQAFPVWLLHFILHLAKAKCDEFFALYVHTNANAAFAPFPARTKR